MSICYLESPEQQLAPTKFSLGTVYLYFKYCNLKCRHCWINPPYSDAVTVKEDELSMPQLIGALDECRAIGMRSLKLTGGEPFTRPDIFELLDYCKENKLSLTIETNGTLIGEKEARALKEAGVWHMAISLDGPTAQIHEELRGVSGSFDAALEGIKHIRQQGINNLQIITSLWRGNIEHIKSTIILARALGANSVKINPINSIARADAMSSKNETLSVKETIEFYLKLKEELKKEPKINVIFDIPPAFKPMVNGHFESVCTCGIFGILGILGDGRISICGIGSASEALILGKVGKDKIKDIWENHPVLKEIRQGVPKKMTGVCGRCIFMHYCLGKCRAEAYYESGSLLAPLSFCEIAYKEGLFPASRIIA
jgi:SynChlorMet cassette radical SAM/SPASM protein ScmF